MRFLHALLQRGRQARLLQIKKPSKRHILIGTACLIGIIFVVQVLYPSSRFLPLASIDTLEVGGWKKDDASWEVDHRLAQRAIPVHRGNEAGIYTTAQPKTLGVTVSSSRAIDAVAYPWYMRLLPTSIFWYGLMQSTSEYHYSYDDRAIAQFITDELADCKLAPKNASLAYTKGSLILQPAKNGGVCEDSEVSAAINALRPTLASPANLTFPATITPPAISDEDAKNVKDFLTRSSKSIEVVVGTTTKSIPYDAYLSWLRFDNTGDTLTYTLDHAKADAYLSKKIAPAIAISPGTTKITTRDFTEVSRRNGAPGRVLDMNATRQSILAVIKGTIKQAVASSMSVPPRVEYTRTYSSSDVGLSALVQQFAKDNPGTFGVQYIELSGQKRRASYNENKQFITASTYKLFVAYSTLKRVESGQWKWSDQVTGGQTLSTCFDKMIVHSDNACAEAMYSKIGYQTTINEARALGLSHTTLDKEAQKTSAGDLAILLGSVYSGTIDLNASSRDRLISAMKRNVYPQGIPAGANGTVADKVGFLDGLLHDASIVYSGKGDYVLVIMSDGSSWGKIAELTRKIESIR